MSDSNKQARTRKYQSLGFGGTTDWAIDLAGDVGLVPHHYALVNVC
jgi:hypothetical protein